MIIALIVVSYLLLMVGLGVVGYRAGTATPDAYFLAGRNVGPVVTFFTLIATNFSAFFFLGFAGAGYRVGWSYYGMMSFGTAITAVAFFLIGDRAWRLGKAAGYITPPELIGDRTGSPSLRVVYLAVMVVFTLPYLALQPVGAGYLLSQLSDGVIGQFQGATLLTAFMVAYVFMGGMRSVALTDVAQGVMIFVLMFLAVMVIGNQFGGVGEANRRAFAEFPELFSRQGGGNFFTPGIWFSYMLLWVCAIPMFPQVFMRFFIPRDASALKLTAVFYPIVTAILFTAPITIGVWGRLAFPELTGNASDQILPMLMAEYAPAWLSGLIIVGALAAFMSTMDSQLLALSSMITRDIYRPFFRPDVSVAAQVQLGRWLVVGLSLLGLAIAWNPPASFVSLVTQAFTGLAVLTPTTLAVLYWPRVTATGCITSVVVGEALVVGFATNIIPASAAMGFLPLVPILLVASVIILALGNWRRLPTNP